MSNTSLYAIRMHGAPFVKIGTARNPTRRLIQLQIGSPFKLFIYATRGGASTEEEFGLHREFSHLRVSGEWFRWEGEVVDAVKLWPRFDSRRASESAITIKDDTTFVESENTRLRKCVAELEDKIAALRHVERNAKDMLDTVQVGLRAIGERFGFDRRNNSYDHANRLAHVLEKLPPEALREALLVNHVAVDAAVDLVRERLNKASAWPLKFPLGASGDWRSVDDLLAEVREAVEHKHPRLHMVGYEQRDPAQREALVHLVQTTLGACPA